MASSRAFMLGNDNHIIGSRIIDCPTDDEALTCACRIGGIHKAVEVWELGRRVGRVDLRHPADAE
jgi:hypothetical protein